MRSACDVIFETLMEQGFLLILPELSLSLSLFSLFFTQIVIH